MANTQARKAQGGRPGDRGVKRLTVYLRPEQVKSLKIRAVQQDRDLSDLMRDLVDEYLKQD
jgi:hypothetical protein